jgi:hypothetical protein
VSIWLTVTRSVSSTIVPLYSCEQCGWATTSFRFDAVREHHSDCPECSGLVRLVFHIRTNAVEPEPTPADLQAERERARERFARRRLRERVARRGRFGRMNGPPTPRRRTSR